MWGAIIKFILFIWERLIRRRDDPIEQNKKRHEQIDKDIANKDGKSATLHGANDLDTLQRMHDSKSNKK